MTGMPTGFRAAAIGLMLGLVVSCTPVYRNHGYVPREDELAQIEVGTDTRETVAEKVGRPSAAGLLNDVGWYYVQSRYELRGGREPKEVDRQVVAITFTEDGRVTDVGRYGLQDGRVIALSRRVTESNIRGVSFIRQLLGNLGNLRATDLLD